MKYKSKKLSLFLGISLGVAIGCAVAFQAVDLTPASNEFSSSVQDANFVDKDIEAVEASLVALDPKAKEADLYLQTLPEEETVFIDDDDYIMPEHTNSYVGDYGVSAEEAERRLRRQIPLATQMHDIRMIQGEDNITAWDIDHGETFKGWIQLVGNTTLHPDSQTILDQNPDIEIRYGGLYSYKTLEDRKRDLDSMLAKGVEEHSLSDEIQEPGAIAYSDIDMDNSTIIVAMNEQWQPRQWSSNADMVTSLQSYFDANADVPVKVIQDSLTHPEQKTLFGGYSLLGCTAGYSIKEKGSKSPRLGILTAGHCSSRQSAYLYNQAKQKDTGDVDAQIHWVRPGHSISKSQKLSDSTRRVMRNTFPRASMKGVAVCRYGKVTKVQCGKVETISYDDRGYGTTNWNLVTIVRSGNGSFLRSCNGDSGGPVFSGYTAMGTHITSRGGTPCTRAVTRLVFGSIRASLGDMNVDLYK